MANLITVQQLKEGYLVGVKLTDENGQQFPNAVYDNAIRSAVGWFELKTKVHLTPFEVADEPHDFHAAEYLRFCWFNVYEYPVLSVNSITAIYPTGQVIMLFPQSWSKVYFKPGQINLVPTAGTLSQVLIGQGGGYLPLLSGRMDYLPQLFHLNYTAGFAEGKIPEVVNDAIGLRAATQIMGMAGTMVIESGLQSKSISIDGLSQSVAAATGQFGPYSGLINNYNQRLDDLIQNIMQDLQGIRMVVL